MMLQPFLGEILERRNAPSTNGGAIWACPIRWFDQQGLGLWQQSAGYSKMARESARVAPYPMFLCAVRIGNKRASGNLFHVFVRAASAASTNALVTCSS